MALSERMARERRPCVWGKQGEGEGEEEREEESASREEGWDGMKDGDGWGMDWELEGGLELELGE